MIPQVRTWNVRVWSDQGKIVSDIAVLAPTKALARIGFRMDYIQYWGYKITISLARERAR